MLDFGIKVQQPFLGSQGSTQYHNLHRKTIKFRPAVEATYRKNHDTSTNSSPVSKRTALEQQASHSKAASAASVPI